LLSQPSFVDSVSDIIALNQSSCFPIMAAVPLVDPHLTTLHLVPPHSLSSSFPTKLNFTDSDCHFGFSAISFLVLTGAGSTIEAGGSIAGLDAGTGAGIGLEGVTIGIGDGVFILITWEGVGVITGITGGVYDLTSFFTHCPLLNSYP